MVKPKADFTRAIVGVLILQRMLRARRYWRKVEGEKAGTQLRPFRVRIHNLYVIVNTERFPLTDAEEIKFAPILQPYNHLIGEMTANSYADTMRPSTVGSSDGGSGLSSTGGDLASLTQSILAMSTSTKSSFDGTNHADNLNINLNNINNGVHSAGSAGINAVTAGLGSTGAAAAAAAESDMLQLLRANHIEAPSYLPPFKPSHSKLVTRGVYFLTVAVQKVMRNNDGDHHDEYRQLFRIDAPLKLENTQLRVTPSNLKKFGLEIDPSMCDKCSHLRIVKFSLLKPYILFPGSDCNVCLKFAVSQVSRELSFLMERVRI
jgi:hypothetical protein